MLRESTRRTGGGRRIVWREIQIGTFIPRKLHKKRPQTREQQASKAGAASESLSQPVHQAEIQLTTVNLLPFFPGCGAYCAQGFSCRVTLWIIIITLPLQCNFFLKQQTNISFNERELVLDFYCLSTWLKIRRHCAAEERIRLDYMTQRREPREWE